MPASSAFDGKKRLASCEPRPLRDALRPREPAGPLLEIEYERRGQQHADQPGCHPEPRPELVQLVKPNSVVVGQQRARCRCLDASLVHDDTPLASNTERICSPVSNNRTASSPSSAASSFGAVISGRRTYDIVDAGAAAGRFWSRHCSCSPTSHPRAFYQQTLHPGGGRARGHPPGLRRDLMTAGAATPAVELSLLLHAPPPLVFLGLRVDGASGEGQRLARRLSEDDLAVWLQIGRDMQEFAGGEFFPSQVFIHRFAGDHNQRASRSFTRAACGGSRGRCARPTVDCLAGRREHETGNRADCARDTATPRDGRLWLEGS